MFGNIKSTFANMPASVYLLFQMDVCLFKSCSQSHFPLSKFFFFPLPPHKTQIVSGVGSLTFLSLRCLPSLIACGGETKRIQNSVQPTLLESEFQEQDIFRLLVHSITEALYLATSSKKILKHKASGILEKLEYLGYSNIACLEAQEWHSKREWFQKQQMIICMSSLDKQKLVLDGKIFGLFWMVDLNQYQVGCLIMWAIIGNIFFNFIFLPIRL